MTDAAAVVMKDASRTPPIARIARSTAIVMVLLSVAKMIALVQKLIIVRRFGVGAEWDTFVAANQVPEQLFSLIAGGALTYAFIPVFGGMLTRGDHKAAWRLVSNVMNTVFVVALAVSVVVFIAAPWLVTHVVAPGFSPDSAAQTAGLMRVLLISLLIFSLSGLASGILQTHQHFLLPALSPIVYDLGVLFGAAFLTRRFGVYGIAYGAVIGAAAHLLIQVPGLIAYGMQWRPRLDLRDPDLRGVIRLMIPRAIGLGLLNINLLVAISLASQLGTGAASAYNWGWALMQLPETLIGTAMGVVIFPTLATLSAAGDRVGKRAAMSGALRFILIGTIPAAFLMVLVGRPLIGILQGGAFSASGADAVYVVLQAFAFGLIVHSCVEIVARSFYADKDTVTPLYVALLSAVINFALALTLPGLLGANAVRFSNVTSVFAFGMWPFSYAGVNGLAVANTVAVSVEVLVLLLILRQRWQGINGAVLITTIAKTLAASLAMSAAIVLIGVLLNGHASGLVQAIIKIGIGVIVFFAVAIALRTREFLELPALLRKRVTSVPLPVPSNG